MIPSALHLSRFRAFLEPARIELAPLTIVIGKNGSGKSVLTRLQLLISGGLWPTSDSVLDLFAGGISRASRYDDLIYQRSAQPFSIGAETSDGQNNLKFVTTVRYVPEIHAPGIEEFELSRNGNRVLRLRLAQPEQLAVRTATFAAQRGEDETEAVRLPPAEPGASFCEPLEAAYAGSPTRPRLSWATLSVAGYFHMFSWSIRLSSCS